jgi:hypothetical protein
MWGAEFRCRCSLLGLTLQTVAAARSARASRNLRTALQFSLRGPRGKNCVVMKAKRSNDLPDEREDTVSPIKVNLRQYR